MSILEAWAVRMAIALLADLVVIGVCYAADLRMGPWFIAFGALTGLWAGFSKAFERAA